MIRRLLAAAATTAGVVLLAASPVAAQPSDNDDFDAAVPLGAVPFQVTADTSEATRAGDDPECIGEDGHTVWYTLTLDAPTELSIDTVGSDYDTTLSAWTGQRGDLVPVACNDDAVGLQSQIVFTAEAGVTYYLMVATFFDSPGGQLVLTGQEAPPLVEVAVTLDATGTVGDGAAVIGGTVDCSQPARLAVVGTLRQQAGRRVTVGSYGTSVDCTGADTPWQATVLGETGLYRRGSAVAVAVAEFADPVRLEVVRDRADGTVRLR